MDGTIFLIIRIAMAAALYAFAGWAVFTIARDIKRQGQLLETRLPMPLSIRVNDGEPVRFTCPALTIGRDPVCDVTIDDLTVSNQHARFTFHHKQWWLEDLSSKNGTYLNQEKILTPVVVTTGDTVRFGQVPVSLEIG